MKRDTVTSGPGPPALLVEYQNDATEHSGCRPVVSLEGPPAGPTGRRKTPRPPRSGGWEVTVVPRRLALWGGHGGRVRAGTGPGPAAAAPGEFKRRGRQDPACPARQVLKAGRSSGVTLSLALVMGADQYNATNHNLCSSESEWTRTRPGPEHRQRCLVGRSKGRECLGRDGRGRPAVDEPVFSFEDL
jgi:hypothetical protein